MYEEINKKNNLDTIDDKLDHLIELMEEKHRKDDTHTTFVTRVYWAIRLPLIRLMALFMDDEEHTEMRNQMLEEQIDIDNRNLRIYRNNDSDTALNTTLDIV